MFHTRCYKAQDICKTEVPELKAVSYTHLDVYKRQALTYAVDRTALCESVLFGTASPNSNFLQEGLIGSRDDMEQFEYNPEKAKELLAEAGYADGYDLRITVNTKYPTSVTIGTAVQAQMKEAGINVQVEQVDSAAWTDMKKNGGIMCSIGNWYVDYNDPDSMLYPVSDGRVDPVSYTHLQGITMFAVMPSIHNDLKWEEYTEKLLMNKED